MPTITVATIVPLPEHRDEVIAIFEETIASVHTEAGCELYALHVGDDRLVMIEKWASPEALEAHSQSPALRKLGASLTGKVAGPPELHHLQPHPAGTAELGAL